MKISHAVGKAGSDEKMIQTGDMRAGADDPGSEETKSVKMKKTPRQPSVTTRTRGTRADTFTFPRLVYTLHQGQVQERPTQERDRCMDDAISTVSFDYSYFNDKLGKMTKEEYNEALSKGERMNRPMIVIEDRKTGAIVAHMCSQKGPGDKWIVRRIGKDLEEMGYGGTRIILKCDQENPIAAVQQEVIKNRLDVATVPRHSPVGESQSNGRVENAIRRVQEQVRAFYDQLKARTGVSLGTDHPVFEWLVEWAATTLTRFVIRGDGKTSYEKIGGRTRDNLPMATFGERVCYLPLKTNKRDRSKLERMREGIWLGMRLRTNEALISTPGGVVKTRTIRILPEDEKWSGASILDVKGTPRRPNPLVDDDNIPEDIAECAFDQQGQDDHDRGHEENASQEPVLVRMSEIVPRTVREVCT